MKVILLKKIAKVGELGDAVSVKPGFARNYLIPQKMALPATKPNLALVEAKRAELERANAELLQKDKDRAGRLEGLTVTIAANAGEEGRLFGSIGPHEIVRAVSDVGHILKKSEVCLPDGPLRQVGEYEIEVHLQEDVTAKLKVVITVAKG